MTTDRRTQMLDTALTLIAERGLRGLTHRAVQDAAGLPHGSVTYYFKTRDQLVLAVVERIIEIDRERARPAIRAAVRALAGAPAETDHRQIAALLQSWWTESRQLLLARYELDLAGARDPSIRDAMRRCGAEFRDLAELVAVQAGSPDPAFDAEVVTCLVDGLMFHFVTRGPLSSDHLSEGVRRALSSGGTVRRAT
ncbi:TetR/AcrR family transcriptional regulator [Actinoplanes flavus]|uniref:TetR family transcriptional regulator n=1 Tax=Actinoplanes flavus TaxID=2820290 RepID=A0ABS3UVM4_9ACTN|nr:TetR family transcriptional regulator [Actinoplanes flavus]MBO3742636.1 TetR family transcriptional regulator [Actinoplanes flavus]